MNESLENSDFNINLDGFEGPIDLLLNLARSQKVDLSKISILHLSEQYLDYINKAKNINLEIASDYLVMAAWLTLLKSRLLLPNKNETDEPTNQQIEEALKFQLQRLQTMQEAATNLFKLPQTGIDIFYRGNNDEVKYKFDIKYTATLYDLLKAYSSQIDKDVTNSLKIETSQLYSVDEAILRIKNMFGTNNNEWIKFNNLLPSLSRNFLINKSAYSSTFVASLELAKEGTIKIKQDITFGEILIKLN